MKNLKYITLVALGLVACEPELDNSIEDTGAYSAGTADFSKYVSVGNSLTAGFADGTVYRVGQENSFPSMLANQFSLAGGGDFTQPYVSDNIGGLLLNGTQISDPRLVLEYGLNGPAPTTFTGTPTTDIANVISGPFNNMGVPDAKVFHLGANGYGNVANLPNANPYFVRMASSANASVMEDITAQSPTFFTLWIGANDILSYATSGGIGTDQAGNLDPTTYIREDITDPNVFASAYNDVLTGLTANGAKGVVCNLPKVTDIPYFTTVPHAPLDPTNPDFGPQIPTLNGIFGQLNLVYAALGASERNIVFSETGPSSVVIKDESLTNISTQITAIFNANPNFTFFVQSLGLPAAAAPLVATLLGDTYGQTRQANAGDLLVLPSSSIIGTTNDISVSDLMSDGLTEELAIQFSAEGITYPLDDQWVLIPSERTAIENARIQFNGTISALATANPNVIMVDMAERLGQLNSGGISFIGGAVSSTYASGGAFSLDGVHPTPRGYSIIANTIIDAINTNYNATIPKVDPGTYPTVYIQ